MILGYLLIGLFFMFVLEVAQASDSYQERYKDEPEAIQPITMGVRITLIVLWPLFVVSFIYNFIKALFI